MKLWVLPLLLLGPFPSCYAAPAAESGSSSAPVKIVSLISNDVILDRFAAAVAATEPLRQYREKALQRHMNPVRYMWMKVTRGTPNYDAILGSKTSNAQAIQQVVTNHALQSAKVIKSLGLSIKDFNIIMRRIQHDPELKRRVLDQAQLYRIESRINERLLCTVAVDDDEVVVGGSGTKVASILDEDFNTPLASNFRRPPRKLELFAKSLKEIEALRIEHAQQIQQEFKMDTVPDCLSKPEVFPVLNQKVQNLCLKFPVQAAEIAQSNGFDSKEFNQLLNRARVDPIFRWRVNYQLSKLNKGTRR